VCLLTDGLLRTHLIGAQRENFAARVIATLPRDALAHDLHSIGIFRLSATRVCPVASSR